MSNPVKKRTCARSLFSKTINKCKAENEGTQNWLDLVETLKTMFSELQALDDEIIDGLSEESEIEADMTTSLPYRMAMSNLINREKSLSNANTSFSVSSGGKSACKNQSIRLPKLQIPTFNGDPLAYTGFMEMFDSTVGNNSSLSDVEKFSYLRSSLKGEAEKAIRGLGLTSANYSEALTILKKRFGSKYTIISSHVRELLQIPYVHNSKGGALRRFCDEIHVHIRALNVLGVASDEYSCFLIQIILSRLPSYIRVIWGREDNDDPKVDELIECLEKEAKAQEFSTDNDLRSATSHSNFRPTYRTNNNASLLPPTSNNDFRSVPKSVNIPKCILCSENHFLNNCKHFLEKQPQERMNILKGHKLCFRCFGPHMITRCLRQYNCKEFRSMKHHTLLHFGLNKSTNSKNLQESPTAVSMNCAMSIRVSLLPTFSAYVQSPSSTKTKRLRFLLDSGSQGTFIRKSAVESLELNCVENCSLNVFGFGEGKTNIRNCRRLEIPLIDQFSSPLILSAFETESLCSTITTGVCETFINNGAIDSSLLADTYDEDVLEIHGIVGADHFFDIVTGKIIEFSAGIKALETRFGYSLCGATSEPHTLVSNHISMEQDLKFLWDLEKIGISRCDDSINLSTSEKHKKFLTSIQLVNGRYEVSWPKKNDTFTILSCEVEAFQRLKSLWCRLRRDQSLLHEYDGILDEYLREGIIEEVSSKSESSLIRYLPHHPVIKKTSESTKVRIVFDASAKDSNGISLNDILDEGCNMNPDSLEILLRSRLRKFIVMCDMKAAFLQIGLQVPDRDLVRFLWYCKQPNGSRELKHFRFTRVVFGVTSSPYILAATIRHHLDLVKHDFRNCDLISQSFYVDDFVVSRDNKEECLEISHDICDIASKMGSIMTKWKSNCTEVIHQNNLSVPEIDKVLGMPWKSRNDTFFVSVNPLPLPTTKRQLLRCIASIYDPFGFVAPYVLTGKIILKDLWLNGLAWDDTLTEDYRKRAGSWWSKHNQLANFEFPRWIGYSGDTVLQLIAFCDASLYGFGVVIYFKDNENKMHFLMAKSRIAPMKKLTIPKLELTAALLSARLSTYVKNAFQVKTTITCYSDSRVTLGWIRGNPAKWCKYVSNRDGRD